MLSRTDFKSGPRIRGDGKHCDLCGCSFPAVRCDKCNSQIFCLSCDDMYHRHPKRRYHLRKAVDPTPTPQARPVLPIKVSHLNTAPGDPSKMPLPPPRKKKTGKSFFDAFRKSSPSSENSPPLPKKEYSWSNRLGSIKKFMSNRPLPPVPPEASPSPPPQSPIHGKNDLSFIIRRVDEKPPQLPQRMQQKTCQFEDDRRGTDDENEMSPRGDEWMTEWNQSSDFNHHQRTQQMPHMHLNGKIHEDSPETKNVFPRPRGQSLEGGANQPFKDLNFVSPPSPGANSENERFNMLQKQRYQQDGNQPTFPHPFPEFAPGMSTSATDLQNLCNPSFRGHQFHNFPMNPMTLHYPHPYPMYPHYPGYSQYAGNSWANLSSMHPSTDGDLSDHSEASNASSKKPKAAPFGARAKRSQSVMYDNRMACPPHMYPFGGYPPPPGYTNHPWNPQDFQMEAPSSPATSVRSFGRSSGRSRRKKKPVASENDEDENDDRMSVSSSPRITRIKYSSPSDRTKKHKTCRRVEKSSSFSSTSEEEAEVGNQKFSPKSMNEPKKGRQFNDDYARVEYRGKKHSAKGRFSSISKPGIEDEAQSPKAKKKGKTAASDDSSDLQREGDTEKDRKIPTLKEPEVEHLVENEVMVSDGNAEAHQISKMQTDIPVSDSQWECAHCTFINGGSERICQVCCKSKMGSPSKLNESKEEIEQETPGAEMDGNSTAQEGVHSPATDGVAFVHEGKDPIDKGICETGHVSLGTDIMTLNSALDEAEKELSRGLMELMKLKDVGPENKSSVLSKHQSPPVLKSDSPLKSDELPRSRKGSQQDLEVNSLRQPSTPFSAKAATSKSVGTDSHDLPEPMQFASDVNQEYNFGARRASQGEKIFGVEISKPSSVGTSENRTPRRDSSCQTQMGENSSEPVDSFPGVSIPYGDRPDIPYPFGQSESVKPYKMALPAYRGYNGGNQGVMHRSHSRASLFGGRINDTRPAALEYDNMGYGLGSSQMYRSLSRSSLTGDSSDPWMPEMRPLRRPDFYLSMEELVERRRQENMRAQGLELVRMIREAEELGFTADDIQVALSNCGKQNPVDWLQTNWKNMVNTVVTLSTNYGKDKGENDIGVLSENESRDALRLHKGNIWAAVTECVEGRQRKFLELSARGNFTRREIVDALTKSGGNVEMAYAHLTTATLKPFLMRIWGTGEGVENQDGAYGDPPQAHLLNTLRQKTPSDCLDQSIESDENEYHSEQEMWDDDDVEEEVSWNEDEEDEEDEAENPESFDSFPENETQVRLLNKNNFASNSITTPESDKSDLYCDAFSSMVGDGGYQMPASPVDETFLVAGDLEREGSKSKKKGTSFLSHLANLRKHKKLPETDETNLVQNRRSAETVDPEVDHIAEKENPQVLVNPEVFENKTYGPLDILKRTYSAIKGTVIGSSNKSDVKSAKSILEARTIIVQNRDAHEGSFIDITETQNGSDQPSETLVTTEYQSSVSSNGTNPTNTEDISKFSVTENTVLEEGKLLDNRDISGFKNISIVFPKEKEPPASDKITEQMINSPPTFCSEPLNCTEVAISDKSISFVDVQRNDVTPKDEKVGKQTILSQKGEGTARSKNEYSPDHQNLTTNTELRDILIRNKETQITPLDTKGGVKNLDFPGNTEGNTEVESPGKCDEFYHSAIEQSSNTDKEVFTRVKDYAYDQPQYHGSKVSSIMAPNSEERSEQGKHFKSSRVFEEDSKFPLTLGAVGLVELKEKHVKGNLDEKDFDIDSEQVSEGKTKVVICKKTEEKPLKLKRKIHFHDSDKIINHKDISQSEFTTANESTPKSEAKVKDLSIFQSESENISNSSESYPKVIGPINDPTTMIDSLENLKEFTPNDDTRKITTENEFHDMMSRIQEKMENCLDVFNSKIIEDVEEQVITGDKTHSIAIASSSTPELTPNDVEKARTPIETRNSEVQSPVSVETSASEANISKGILEEPVVEEGSSNGGDLNDGNIISDEKIRAPDEMKLQEEVGKTLDDSNLNGNLLETSEEHHIEESHVEIKNHPSEVEITVISQQRMIREDAHPEEEADISEATRSAPKHEKHRTMDLVTVVDEVNIELTVAQHETQKGEESSNTERKNATASQQKKRKKVRLEQDTRKQDTHLQQEAELEEMSHGQNISDGVAEDKVSYQGTLNDLKEQFVEQMNEKSQHVEKESPVSSFEHEDSDLTKMNGPNQVLPTQEERRVSSGVQEAPEIEGSLNEKTSSPFKKYFETLEHSAEHSPSRELPENSHESKDRIRVPCSSDDAIVDQVVARSELPKASSSDPSVDNGSTKDSELDLHNTDYELEPSTLPNGGEVSATASNPLPITDEQSSSEESKDTVPFASGRAERRISATVEALRMSFEGLKEASQPIRPQSPFVRMTSLRARREAIAQERSKESTKKMEPDTKPWFLQKNQTPSKTYFTKKSIKQQLEFERKVRKLVSEKKCRTYRKAETVVQLLEMNFSENEALQAANECSTLEQAISYLQQECPLCTGMYPVEQIVSMTHCQHKACKGCIKAYFTIQIRDRTIMELLCPFCNEPDISDEDVAQDYFNHLDIMLKKLVDLEIHELFQRKLRDRVLMKDPNFRWCSQCSSGFIAMPNLKRLICPDCNAVTCASCRRPWEREHERVTCEEFAAWKEANDPESQSADLAKLLYEDGIDCPSCHFRYTLAKGGCMHFRCIQCQHDFCSGCSRPFKMGQKCGVSEFCAKLGLHAHHPRNCLFYLRDKDPEDLQRLLDMNDIHYDKEFLEDAGPLHTCRVMEQKETSEGMLDDVCGKEVVEGYAGLCRVHYVEYLGQLVNKHAIDPIQIFCNDDLELVLRRASKRLPSKSYRESEMKYREKLVKLIEEELPLDKMDGS